MSAPYRPSEGVTRRGTCFGLAGILLERGLPEIAKLHWHKLVGDVCERRVQREREGESTKSN